MKMPYEESKYKKKVKISPPPIHTHYNEENQRAELCGRVVCPYGFVGVEIEEDRQDEIQEDTTSMEEKLEALTLAPQR